MICDVNNTQLPSIVLTKPFSTQVCCFKEFTLLHKRLKYVVQGEIIKGQVGKLKGQIGEVKAEQLKETVQ